MGALSPRRKARGRPAWCRTTGMTNEPPALDPGLNKRPALWWIILGLTAAAIWVGSPLWPALILAAWTAALMRPLLVRFEKGLKGRRSAAAVLSLLLFLVLLAPLALVVVGVLSGAQELVQV